MDLLTTAVLAVGLLYAFLNGLQDSASMVAVVISSRAMAPRRAMLWIGLGEFLGPFLFGLAVARTIGAELLDVQVLTLRMLLASLLGAILWMLITWAWGIPSSSSHALVGGLLGPVLLHHGPAAVHPQGLEKVLLALFISPPLGFTAGYAVMRFWYWALRHATPRVNVLFRRGQVLTSFLLAIGHGSNDAQKSMGLLTLGLLLGGYLPEFRVPLWVQTACAAAMAIGASVGAWRLIRTIGGRVFRIRPVHGFSAQASGAAVVGLAAYLGGPVSTTHVLNAAILGTGAAERLSKVRWQVAQEMLRAWLLTIPVSGLLAAALDLLLFHLLPLTTTH